MLTRNFQLLIVSLVARLSQTAGVQRYGSKLCLSMHQVGHPLGWLEVDAVLKWKALLLQGASRRNRRLVMLINFDLEAGVVISVFRTSKGAALLSLRCVTLV